MSDKPQIWDVPISHEERFQLFEAAFKGTTVEDGPDGKKYRRMARAFGLASIRDAARKNEGALSLVAINSPEQRLFKVTAENVEIVLTKVSKSKRSLGAEMVLGELFDRLEVAQANGKDPADDARREDWEKIPVFSAEEDAKLWSPPAAVGPLTCPSCAQEFTLEEARAAAAKAAAPPVVEAAPAPAAVS